MKNYLCLILVFFVFWGCNRVKGVSLEDDDTAPLAEARIAAITTPRDKFLWPFASNSIWNMPIGSKASYKNASLYSYNATGQWTSYDLEIIRTVPAGSPTVPLYAPMSWNTRCGGTASATGNPTNSVSVLFPASWTFADATATDTPNNCAAFIQPDGQTVVSLAPLARCTAGGPVYGWFNGNQNLYTDGIRGSHGGSGLSAIGGSIRLGELTGAEPIRHALKINVWGPKYLYYRANDATPGFRWPADRADSYAPTAYGGTNAQVEMGALLAIPRNVTAASLGLVTDPAKKLLWTLQNYGAYIVDDTGWDVAAFCVAEGVPDEFATRYGFAFATDNKSSAWFQDYYKIVRALSVIQNNAATAVGGGGTPGQPLAPPIGN